MESKQCRPSVIARLMGLDELPPQRSVQKPKRVLSENYLRRVASIGVRKKCSSHEFHSRNMNSGDQKEFKDAFQLVETLKGDEYSDMSVEKESLGENTSVDEKLETSIEFQDSPEVINYKNDDLPQHFPKHLYDLQGLLPISHARPLEVLRSLCTSVEAVHPGEINFSKFARPWNGRILVEEKGRKNLFYSVRPIGKRSSVTRQMLEEVSRRTRRRMISIPKKVPSSGESGETFATKQQLLMPPSSNFSYVKSSKRSYAYSDHFYEAREAKKRLFERWKMMKRSEEVALDFKGSMLHDEPKNTCKGNQPVLNFMNNDLDNDTVVSPRMVADAETSCIVLPFVKQNKELANDGDYSSHEMDTSVQQEAYKPNPVSVLKPPFTDEIPPHSSDDIRGMWSHLELPKSDISDAYSEGSGIIISTEEGSKGSSKQKEYFFRSCSVEESRKFSYLVDVLTEAGFHGRNLEVDFSNWHSLEFAVSLSVFDSLEKKYGDKVSWKRSERKLLFDRINAGLMEILLPKREKFVLRRLNPYPNEVMINNHLWILLNRQEKEASGKDSVKLIEDEINLDLRDDIDAIGREIEGFLVDELVAEFVSMDSF